VSHFGTDEKKGRITRWLERSNVGVFSAYAIIAAFCTYFCMYAFRRPFAAADFEGQVDLPWGGTISWKVMLVVSQVLGYTISKFAGIKVVSEMTPARRGLTLIGLIAVAELALLIFAFLPRPWAALALFMNGLPLGMVWGLVFSFLEGRKTTEALGAGLSASYILASGAVKTVGALVLTWGVSEEWMPFVTGLLFFPPFVFFVWLLTLLPKPTAEDEALRTRREPMDKAARRRFFRAFGPGLVALTGLYVFLTAYRSVRDDFAVNIWKELGFGGAPEIMTWSEVPVAFGVMVALGLLAKIRDNRHALAVVHGVMAGGAALIGLCTLLFQLGLIGPEIWMISVGLGCYLAYVPFGSMLFDRLIAAAGWVATAGFMIYVTDAFGYVGSVAVTLFKDFGAKDLSWLEFFTLFSYFTSILCFACFVFAGVYLVRRTRSRTTEPSAGQASPPV
jgi:MFS family permease